LVRNLLFCVLALLLVELYFYTPK